MIQQLGKNAIHFASEGETAKAQACLELIAFVRGRGFEELRGRVELV